LFRIPVWVEKKEGLVFGSEIGRPSVSTLDEIALGLAQMRIDAGAISFTELTARIQRRRESRGMDPIAARIPRSTVYDAFIAGRRRVDPDLVAEIVLALGADDSTAAEWRAAAIRVMRSGLPQPAHVSATAITDSPPPPPGTALTGSAIALLTVFVASVFVNIVAHVPVDPLGLPIYLDTIGTAIAAIAFGPWIGAAVGLTSNLLSSTVIADWPGMWFALVNATAGLIWGFGYHRFGLRSPLKFVFLSALVALGCTIVASPILVLVFGGSSGSSQDTILSLTGLVGAQLWGTVFSSNMLTSLTDKTISGLVALAVVALFTRLAHRQFRRNE
jgi:energy-coupling factor transport system substrate-specific component